MKRTLFLVLSFVLCMMLSCNNKPEENAPEVKEINLKGEIVDIDSTNKTICPELLLGKLFIGRNRYQESLAGVLDSRHWYKADTLFVPGHGHYEFEGLALAKNKEHDLYLLNRPMAGAKLLSLTIIKDADSISNIKDVTKWKKHELSSLAPFICKSSEFIALSDSTILLPGAETDDIEHIFHVVNFKNQTITPLDYWPDDGFDGKSSPKNTAYTENATLYQDGKGHYFYQSQSGLFAFIFTIENDKVNIVKELYSEYPKYKQDEFGLNKVWMPLEGSPRDIMSYATDSNIYVLYKDSSRKGKKRDDWMGVLYGNTVEVFDWNGTKQKILHLDKFGHRIYVSEDNKTLYLWTEDDNDEMLLYAFDI